MRALLPSVAVLLLCLVPGAAGAEEDHTMGGIPMDLAAKKLGVPMKPPDDSTVAQADLAKEIGREVVCLCKTCPKRLISDCDCPWAVRNQAAILQAVVQGRNKREIVAAYRSVYGEQVLAMLPNEGVNVLAWALPVAGAIGGLFGVFFVGRRFSRKKPATPAPIEPAPGAKDNRAADDDARADLKRELEDLD